MGFNRKLDKTGTLLTHTLRVAYPPGAGLSTKFAATNIGPCGA